MPLSKQAYEDTRRRANDRIRKWIADLNAEKERGIPKLRKEYKHVFKTIEWTGRGKKDVKQDSSIDSVSSSESEDLEIKARSLFHLFIICMYRFISKRNICIHVYMIISS